MKPSKAAFISVLKPIQDVRLFHKLALSWLEYGFEIHCFGFGSVAEASKNYEKAYFYTIFRQSRLHWSRVLVGFRLLWYLLKIRPEMLVCGAVEALPFCLFYKLLSFLCFRKVYLCYDIQENYAANILFTQSYPKNLRKILAKFTRLCEWCCSWWVDMFFLAEKCYVEELPFLSGRFLVLENKFLQKDTNPPQPTAEPVLHFLHTGTLAKEYGIEKVIDFIQYCRNQAKGYHFSIVGKCSQRETLKKLQSLESEDVSLCISLSPLAYKDILAAYKQGSIVLMPYQINEAYKNRIPTKFYEAMAHNTWIWVQENPAWRLFFEEYGYKKVVFTDFWQEPINFEIISKNDFLRDFSFDNPNIFWEKEKEKIFLWLQKLNFLSKSSKKS